MKKNNLKICQTAVGNIVVFDGCSCRFWQVPIESPVHMQKLLEDLAAICSGTKHTPYLEYLGRHEDWYLSECPRNLIAPYSLLKYKPKKQRLVGDPVMAGPDNLRLFGVEDLIDEIPQFMVQFHNETNRVCRQLIEMGDNSKDAGDVEGGRFAFQAANAIQNLKQRGLKRIGTDNTEIWRHDNVWEVLAKVSRCLYPAYLENVLQIYIAAYELDNTYIPVSDEFIECVEDTPKARAALSEHQANAPKPKDDEEQEC